MGLLGAGGSAMRPVTELQGADSPKTRESEVPGCEDAEGSDILALAEKLVDDALNRLGLATRARGRYWCCSRVQNLRYESLQSASPL